MVIWQCNSRGAVVLRESGDVRGGQGVGFADFVWFCGIHSLGQVTDEEL